MQSNDINQAYATEQEAFWAGEFGNNYIGRNVSETYLASNIALFARILSKTTAVSSVLEFGANAGLNLQAIAQLLPSSELSAVEINQNAVQKLQQLLNGRVNVYHNSILDKELPPLNADFVLIKGVLIHINPEHLGQVYENYLTVVVAIFVSQSITIPRQLRLYIEAITISSLNATSLEKCSTNIQI